MIGSSNIAFNICHTGKNCMNMWSNGISQTCITVNVKNVLALLFHSFNCFQCNRFNDYWRNFFQYGKILADIHKGFA